MNEPAYWIVIRVVERDGSDCLLAEYLSSPYKLSHPNDWYLSTVGHKARHFKSQKEAEYAVAQYGDEQHLVAVPVNTQRLLDTIC